MRTNRVWMCLLPLLVLAAATLRADHQMAKMTDAQIIASAILNAAIA